ncbi:MFS transporter, DHA1 family, arabinose polymer transporter [Aliiroseovarius crassostreae]|uniref:Major facilitator superfamily (MFS) profile domain-containing protein n=1 Tax=Aliiroseovarius crassostreae TaxID=154981 RepID=A0A0P7HY65_9RHOB|nr:MFS transporter [Aliiroseovarius crassostreae]KPN61548.1 hypothetical protein AKJ29_18365 [Aliiroseovarius crassostreae]SFU92630.1 MFS transporter, DHA1 family, arabinose polymer transporter [Aliiroseovarius crassostreae]
MTDQTGTPSDLVAHPQERSVADAPVFTLALTAFAAGLSEFIVIGLIGQITQNYGVGLAAGGWLVAAYALGIAIGAPLLTFASLAQPARRLAVWMCAGFALFSLGCAFAPTFGSLIAFRALCGVLHGAYFTVATASLPSLFNEKRMPMALALMFSGLTVAMVLGVPLGMLLAAQIGWQAPFLVIALCAGIGAGLIPLVLPKDFGTAQTPTLPVLRDAVFRRDLLRPYGFTIFAFGGGFVFFTYAEPWMTTTAGLSPTMAGLVLGLVGLGALVGNVIGGALPQTFGKRNALLLVVLVQLAGLGGASFGLGAVAAAVALAVWSVGAFATAPMVHGWAISTAQGSNPRMAAALNVTAFNAGLSLSAMIGRTVMAQGGLEGLAPAAFLVVALALPIALSLPTDTASPRQTRAKQS